MERIGIGLDGGGSATRWVACGAGGIVARGEAPGVLGYLSAAAGRDRFAEIARLVAQARPPGEIAGVVAGLTGLSEGTPEAACGERMLADALGIAPDRVRVTNDMHIAWHALFRPGEGHAVYSGTGSIGMHIRTDGTLVQVGGRGPLIDDAGSAFWIGREALDWMWRRLDEDPGAGGALHDALVAAIGGAAWERTRAYVYDGGRTAVAALAQAVAAADGADARRILAQAGRELARLALALVQREGPRPVALLGRAAGLHPAILIAMRAAAPMLAIERQQPDAAVAAARMALSNSYADSMKVTQM